MTDKQNNPDPIAHADRLHAHAESLAARQLAASPTPPAEQQAAPKAAPGEPVKQTVREQIAAEVATQPAAQVEFLARWLCERDQINPDQVLDYDPIKLAWHREDLNAARLLAKLAELAPQQEAQADSQPVPVVDKCTKQQITAEVLRRMQQQEDGHNRNPFRSLLDRLMRNEGGYSTIEIGQLKYALDGFYGAARAQADSVTAPAATVIKKGADRQWMSERLGHLPDGIYSLYLAPQQEAQEPYAYAVYFPDQPTEELVHDLDELTDDLTNREHQITKLYTAPQPAPAPLSDEREAFESTWENLYGKKPVLWDTAFKEAKMDVPAHSAGKYFYRDAQAAWKAWQARAALAARGGQ